MQKLSTIKRVTAILFTLLMLWGAFYIAKIVLEINPNRNLDYIPKDAQFVAKIDGRQLFEKGIKSIVLEEDQEIITLIDEIFDRKTGGEKRKSLGIAFHSDILFFNVNIRNENVSGLLFNLSSPKTFETNISSILHDNQTYAHRDHVGVILHLPEKGESKLTIADLQIQADQMLSKKSTFNKANLSKNEVESTIVKSWSNSGLFEDGGIVSESDLSFELKENIISVNGTLAFEDHKPSLKKKRLKVDKTHLTSTIVSSTLSDSINLFFSGLNLPKAEIISVSINYHGTEIVEEPSFFIVPYIDMLVETNDSYDIQAVLDSASRIESDIELAENYFKYGGKAFYFKQLAPSLFYIGITKNPEIETISDDLYLDFSGSLSHLTQFYGKGIMRKFLEIIPLYSACKDLASKIEKVDFKIKNQKNKEGKVHGEIIFKEENYALNALIHFAIDGHLIK